MDPGSHVPVYFLTTLRVCFLERKGHVSMCFIAWNDNGCGNWRMLNTNLTSSVCPFVMPFPEASWPQMSMEGREGLSLVEGHELIETPSGCISLQTQGLNLREVIKTPPGPSVC